jgi:hypothetical protein
MDGGMFSKAVRDLFIAGIIFGLLVGAGALGLGMGTIHIIKHFHVRIETR